MRGVGGWVGEGQASVCGVWGVVKTTEWCGQKHRGQASVCGVWGEGCVGVRRARAVRSAE